jgi:AbrB family looped-hinge helix DNA binding protein
MIATGIIRSVDDLGRVVIPKEIRRNLGIKDGDPLEISITRNGEIVFKPYQEENIIINNFIETFKKMDNIDKEKTIKILIEEMEQKGRIFL